MIGETVSHYRVIDRLGDGGMGVVFKAEDLRLGRLVAIKVLPPHLSQVPDAIARFRDEARAASSLDHPNICTVYDIDQAADGRLFMAMALYEGETLKQRLARGALAPDEALRIAAQVADGLARAHERGIVHRDIKPANVMLKPDGLVKILDFGVAKLVDSPALTRPGLTVGTPLYMSPEQVRGEPVDNRTDLWSLGALLYEMLAGAPPFGGETSAAVSEAILREEPVPVSTLRPAVPPQASSIVSRLLSKSRAERHSSASEVARALRNAEPSGSRTLTARGKDTGRAGWRIGRSGGSRLMAGAALLAVTVLIVIWRAGTSSPPDGSRSIAASAPVEATVGRQRIVVLPFDNLGSSEDRYFAEGMTEEITSRLAAASGLAVISRTSALQYDRKGKTLRQIEKDLGVDYVLEGSVRWARGPGSSRVRITPQLVRAADDTHMWTHSYDATMDDVFKVQSEIARQVIDALQVALSSGEQRILDARPTSHADAYYAYLRGLSGVGDASDTSSQAQGLASFEEAVALDPAFALAWCELAKLRTARYSTGVDRSAVSREAARTALRTALRLDPELPQARLANALYLTRMDRDYAAALAELEMARARLPNSTDVLTELAQVQLRQGRFKEARITYGKVLELDPMSAMTAQNIAVTYAETREYDAALHFAQRARAIDPSLAYAPHAWAVFSANGDVSRAREILESSPGRDERIVALLARLELFDGRYGRALELTRSIPSRQFWWAANFRFPAAIAEAHVYDAMGRTAMARERYGAAAAILIRELRERPDDYQVEAGLGLAYAGLERAEEAVRHGRRAVELLPVTRDAREAPVYLYALAMIHARVGQADAALGRIEEMLSVPGFYNRTWVERDPAFARLRQDRRFKELAQR
jgi:serine/threonine-protein kinase